MCKAEIGGCVSADKREETLPATWNVGLLFYVRGKHLLSAQCPSFKIIKHFAAMLSNRSWNCIGGDADVIFAA